MGTYVYKVTAKKVKLTDGSFANLAVFAYKPSFSDQFNVNCYSRTKCYLAEKFVKESPNYTGKIVMGEIKKGTKALQCKVGVFDDYESAEWKVVGEVA